MRPIVLDCTELYQNPVRTGIQRVVRELIRNWPADGPKLHPARFVPHTLQGLAPISNAALNLLLEVDDRAASLSPKDLALLIHEAGEGEVIRELPSNAHILIPEVFFEPLRSGFYTWLSQTRREDICAICYDFIPFLRPDLFGNLRSTASLMPYILALRASGRLAHISAKTRLDYAQYIARTSVADVGVILPLGADGIRIERQKWRPDRSTFVAIGSIDGRKRQKVVLEAFRLLREQNYNVQLTLIGRAFKLQDVAWLREAAQLPGFRWIEDASDTIVADVLREARATIYVSEAEGYGLPPVESLWAGIPVIAAADMPSLMLLDKSGQIRVEDVNPASLAKAMLSVLDQSTAKQLWSDTSRLELPTWKEFARETVTWVSSEISN